MQLSVIHALRRRGESSAKHAGDHVLGRSGRIDIIGGMISKSRFRNIEALTSEGKLGL